MDISLQVIKVESDCLFKDIYNFTKFIIDKNLYL